MTLSTDTEYNENYITSSSQPPMVGDTTDGLPLYYLHNQLSNTYGDNPHHFQQDSLSGTEGRAAQGSSTPTNKVYGQLIRPTKKVKQKRNQKSQQGVRSWQVTKNKGRLCVSFSNTTGKGHGKLWEFIRDLLLSPETNPSLIRWKRREDGVFKFVNTERVAQLWGQRKQNSRMTYEKLSRAIR